MRGGTLRYLSALAVLCVAMGSQVADVVATKKAVPPKGAGTASATPGGVTPPASAVSTATAKITTSTVAAAAVPFSAHAVLSASTTPATRTASAAALARTSSASSKRAPRPSAHRSTRKTGGDDAANGGTAMTPAAHTAESAGGGSSVKEAGGSGLGQEVEVNLTDVANLKLSVSIKPFVKQGAYPFVVTVQKTCGNCHTKHTCAGVLLAPQWVMSLPQCAETHPGEGLVVRGGDSFIWPGDHSPTQRVVEVVWHEAVTSTEDYPKYDIILMRLENSFQFNENINAINLAPPSHNSEGGVAVVGWATPGHAEQVELNVTHGAVKQADECQRIAPQEVLPGDTLCVQPVEPFLERSAYDLGDPVIESDPPLLVGLLSRWYLPFSSERPVVAIKVSAIYGWVYEKVNPPPVTARPTHSSPADTAPTSQLPPATTTPSWAPAPPYPTTAATVSSPSSATATTPPWWTHHTSVPPTPSAATTWPPLPPATSPNPVTTSAPSAPNTTLPARPSPTPLQHIKPMTVSSSSASGALSNTSSTSDAALLAGHMESSLSYSLGTAGVEAAKPALANSVAVGWANCRDVGGALGMSYALAYSFIGEGAATAASSVNATCLEVNAVQSQGWSISTSGSTAPLSVRAFVLEHLASIPGLPRQPSLRYL